jgi:predicted double-glycine peptidase
MRSEVRLDNDASLALFRKAGYHQFDKVDDYYEDHMGALRFERTLAPPLDLTQVPVPYYEQTTDFTCGPASLMMAMKALEPELTLDRKVELRLWRESTSIFMTSGHGGCGPYGLALSAHHRGYKVEVFVKEHGVFLVDTVRSPEKKEVMRLVHEDMLAEVQRLDIPVIYGTLSLDELQARFAAGTVPLVLISSYRIYEEKFPHWVVVTGFDEHFVYVNDPYVDHENGETTLDSINMPIQQREFRRMARYGRAGLQAVVLIARRAGEGGGGG